MRLLLQLENPENPTEDELVEAITTLIHTLKNAQERLRRGETVGHLNERHAAQIASLNLRNPKLSLERINDKRVMIYIN